MPTWNNELIILRWSIESDMPGYRKWHHHWESSGLAAGDAWNHPLLRHAYRLLMIVMYIDAYTCIHVYTICKLYICIHTVFLYVYTLYYTVHNFSNYDVLDILYILFIWYIQYLTIDVNLHTMNILHIIAYDTYFENAHINTLCEYCTYLRMRIFFHFYTYHA